MAPNQQQSLECASGERSFSHVRLRRSESRFWQESTVCQPHSEHISRFKAPFGKVSIGELFIETNPLSEALLVFKLPYNASNVQQKKADSLSAHRALLSFARLFEILYPPIDYPVSEHCCMEGRYPSVRYWKQVQLITNSSRFDSWLVLRR